MLLRANITGKLLKEFYKIIRMAVRTVLHPPRILPDAYIYASIKDGGLEVMNMTDNISANLRRRLARIVTKADATLRAVLSLDYAERLFNKLNVITQTTEAVGMSSYVHGGAIPRGLFR